VHKLVLSRIVQLVKVVKVPAPISLALLLSLTLAPPVSASEVVANQQRYFFPVAGCEVKYGQYHHDYPASDIFAAKGCRFLATTSGVIDEISRVDLWSGRENLGQTRGGLFVSLIGDDGVRYYGSHLSKVSKKLEVGVRVKAGRYLGKIGTTGSARGTPPHLHYGISWPTENNNWLIRRGMISPYKYLQAWQAGEDLSPSRAVKRLMRKAAAQ